MMRITRMSQWPLQTTRKGNLSILMFNLICRRRNDDLLLFSSSFPVNSTNPNANQNASTLSSIPDVYEPGTNDDPNAAHNLTELDTLGLPLIEIFIQHTFIHRIA